MTDDELFEICSDSKKFTEYIKSTIPEWRRNTDGFVYECGGFTFYKTPNGYMHCDGKPATKLEKWLYGLK